MTRLLLAVSQLALLGGGAVAKPLLQAAEGVYVGRTPDKEVWTTLEARGVRTVVSVEGTPPDAPTGAGWGVRLVHIPIGYEGVDRHACELLTRVAREAERPLYIYCHRGRHRGPAAAAIVCRAADLLNEAGAIDLLRRARTDRKYVGLWRDVATYRPPPIDASLPPLTEASPTSPLRLAMCRLDRAWDATQQATTREAHREAMVLVVESLRESLRGANAEEAAPDLIDQFRQAIAYAETSDSARVDPDSSAWRDRFEQRCHHCHATHRDDHD